MIGKFIFGVKTTKIHMPAGAVPQRYPWKRMLCFSIRWKKRRKRATGLVKDVNRNSVSQNRRSRKCAASSYCSKVNVKSGKMQDYLQMAGALKDSLAKAEGFIRSERFSSLAAEGKILSLSVWESEECVSKWRNLAAHRLAQSCGRRNAFADYKITVAAPVRTYTMTDRAEAPADSNAYWEV